MKHEIDEKFILFDDRVKVWLPDGFCENSELIGRRYPYKNRPSVIKADNTGKVFITFDLYPQPLNVSQVTGAALSIKNMIWQIYPYNDKMVLKHFKTSQGLKGVSFSFCSRVSRDLQYVDLFVLSIHDRLFIGTAACPEKIKMEWDSDFIKVKRGVREIEKNNRKGVFQ